MHSIADKNETAPVVNALVRIPSRTKTISATFAPKAEAEDMPSVDADAKRVAVQLGIDFKVFDFESEYKQQVVDYMIEEYKAGRTPNPDVMCNQEVKFKLFLDAALADGADMIATGHYAQVTRDPSNDSAHLMLAKDTDKDQTYFLYRVTEEALKKTLFPLGEYTKPEVREMAKKRNLWTATKKESMGVCFVGSVGMREFLSEYIETRPGDIIDKTTGQVLGRHDGAIFYTIGQRHGLELGGGLPYYVVGKDMQKNEVYVSTNLNDEVMWRKDISLGAVHWISEPIAGDCLVRVRHRAPLVAARVEFVDGETTVHLAEPQRAITAGQSIVIYRDKKCLGGGIIIIA